MYVVETDREAVARSRRFVLRTRRQNAWISLVGGGLIIGLAVALAVGLGPWVWAIVQAVPGVILVADGSRRLGEYRRLRATWIANDIPPVALVLSAEGLRCHVDGEPVFLPWPAVARVRRERRRGLWSLVVEPAPTAPGPPRGVLKFRENTLLRSPEEIDRALADVTGGRLRLR